MPERFSGRGKNTSMPHLNERSVLRLQIQTGVTPLDRLLVFPELPQGLGCAEVRLDVLGIQLLRLFAVGDRGPVVSCSSAE